MISFEHKHQHLLSTKQYLLRIGKSLLITLGMVGVSLVIGMCGYHYLENLPWIDAFLEASMILGGMGPVNVIKTNAGKIFAGLYALYSGLLIIAAMGILLAPALHRMMHKFHLPKD